MNRILSDAWKNSRREGIRMFDGDGFNQDALIRKTVTPYETCLDRDHDTFFNVDEWLHMNDDSPLDEPSFNNSDMPSIDELLMESSND